MSLLPSLHIISCLTLFHLSGGGGETLNQIKSSLLEALTSKEELIQSGYDLSPLPASCSCCTCACDTHFHSSTEFKPHVLIDFIVNNTHIFITLINLMSLHIEQPLLQWLWLSGAASRSLNWDVRLLVCKPVSGYSQVLYQDLEVTSNSHFWFSDTETVCHIWKYFTKTVLSLGLDFP